MKDSTAFDFIRKPINTVEDSFYGGNNPFYNIEKKNRDRLLQCKTNKERVQSSIVREFDAWDLTVSTRLKQLSEAVSPELHHTPYFRLLRILSKQNIFWMMFGSRIKYRITRYRNEGMWKLEFYNHGVNSNYGQNEMIRVRFLLDDRSNPIGFHLCRGSDNQIFRTSSLSEDELTRSLVCHFSRLSCGSNQQDDLDHLRFLHDNKIISTADYVIEKQGLLSNHTMDRLHILPAKPAGEPLKQKVQVVMFIVALGVLLVAATLLCVHKLFDVNMISFHRPSFLETRW